jgi:hypothetical protein
LVFKANSVRQQQILFFEVSLETMDIFSDTIRRTQKVGMLLKTSLTFLNCFSEWEVIRYFEQVNCVSRKILILSIFETCSLYELLDNTSVAIGRGINYRQWVNIRSLYKKYGVVC